LAAWKACAYEVRTLELRERRTLSAAADDAELGQHVLAEVAGHAQRARRLDW
jgi:hypothetical protein